MTITLKPEYLETLASGEHTVRFEFTADGFAETTFSVSEKGGLLNMGNNNGPAASPVKDNAPDNQADKIEPAKTNDPGKEAAANRGTESESPNTGDYIEDFLPVLILTAFAGAAAYCSARKKSQQQ